MVAHLTATSIAGLITDPSARGIAAEMAVCIRSGQLASGARLPTVRSLAFALQVGPTTVASAWSILKNRRLIRADRRSAAFVCDASALSDGRLRYAAAGTHALDLTTPEPDPDVLPDVDGAMSEVLAMAGRELARGGLDRHLAEQVRPAWPFAPELMTPTHGGREAIAHALRVLVHPGQRVAVESACDPALLDILEDLSAIPVAVACDDEGPLPESLAAALRLEPVAVLVQPRTATPRGQSLTAPRAEELSRVLVDSDCLVVEDDRTPALAKTPAVSLGFLMPERTVLARSWNTSHGPSLRVGMLAGAERVVAQVLARQRLVGGLPTSIAQRTLAVLLADRRSQHVVDLAAEVYAERRTELIDALRRRGIEVVGRGLSAWVPVGSADRAHALLGARGVGVAHGSWFTVGGAEEDHVSIAVTTPHDRHDELARILTAGS